MDSKNKVEVNICGHRFKLMGVESEEYIYKVAKYIDDKINEVIKIKGNSTGHAAILAAINVADEYYKTNEELNNARRNLSSNEIEIKELKKRLNHLSSKYSKLQFEEAKKYNLKIENLEKEKKSLYEECLKFKEVNKVSKEQLEDLNEKLEGVIEQKDRLEAILADKEMKMEGFEEEFVQRIDELTSQKQAIQNESLKKIDNILLEKTIEMNNIKDTMEQETLEKEKIIEDNKKLKTKLFNTIKELQINKDTSNENYQKMIEVLKNENENLKYKLKERENEFSTEKNQLIKRLDQKEKELIEFINTFDSENKHK